MFQHLKPYKTFHREHSLISFCNNHVAGSHMAGAHMSHTRYRGHRSNLFYSCLRKNRLEPGKTTGRQKSIISLFHKYVLSFFMNVIISP